MHRRQFLADFGMGFTGLSLGAMLAADGVTRASDVAAHQPPTGHPQHRAPAKRCIWIFLSGGYSHMETFDPKPALNTYAGKTIQETPYPVPFADPLHDLR